MTKIANSSESGNCYIHAIKALDLTKTENRIFAELIMEHEPIDIYFTLQYIEDYLPFEDGGKLLGELRTSLSILKNAFLSFHLKALGCPVYLSWGDDYDGIIDSIFSFQSGTVFLRDFDYMGDLFFGAKHPESFGGKVYLQFKALMTLFFKHHAHLKGWDISELQRPNLKPFTL
ncbi:MAG: hypothetical protein AAFZ15_27550 [Bacteroidota bacterium]